jgi:hypothetical protein
MKHTLIGTSDYNKPAMKNTLVVAGIIWLGLWFWAFSFAYSSDFFLYNRPTRLPILFACLFGVSVLPISAVLQWRRVTKAVVSPTRAFGCYGLWSIAVLGLPLALIFLFSRASGAWHLEADDAMGAGIVIALLLLVAVVIAIIFGVALAVRVQRLRGR